MAEASVPKISYYSSSAKLGSERSFFNWTFFQAPCSSTLANMYLSLLTQVTRTDHRNGGHQLHALNRSRIKTFSQGSQPENLTVKAINIQLR